MSGTQYKTITQVKKEFEEFKGSDSLPCTVWLTKIAIKFVPTANGGTDQMHEVVPWDSNNFQNLDLVTKEPTEKLRGPWCTTITGLTDALRAFLHDHQNAKNYPLTYDGKLFERITPMPKVTCNPIAWKSTTLADAYKEKQKLTYALELFINSQTAVDNDTDKMDLIQRVIETNPSRPADFAVYCLKNAENKYTLFHDRTNAYDAFFAGQGALVKHVFTDASIFKQITPNLYQLRAEVQEMTDKLNEIQKKVETLA